MPFLPRNAFLMCMLILAGCVGSPVNQTCDDPSRASSPRCGDTLSQYREALAATYQKALNKAKGDARTSLIHEQQLWNTEPVRCEVPDPLQCQQRAYQKRVASLTISYALAAPQASATLHCDNTYSFNTAFYATTLPSMTLTTQGHSYVLFLDASGSGSRYTGKEASYWEHQEEAEILLGDESPMRCKVNR